MIVHNIVMGEGAAASIRGHMCILINSLNRLAVRDVMAWIGRVAESVGTHFGEGLICVMQSQMLLVV